MTFTIGRSDKNDITYPDASVSGLHAKLIYQEDSKELVLVDANSTNGTFVDGRPIQRVTVQESSKVTFGRVQVEGQELLHKATQLFRKFKTDYSDEFLSIIQQFEKYQKAKDKIINPSKLPQILRVGAGIAIIAALILFKDYIRDDLRIVLMMSVGVLSAVASGMGPKQSEKQEMLDMLRLEYEDVLVCPKCKYKLINKSLAYWRGKKTCGNTKCNAVLIS